MSKTVFSDGDPSALPPVNGTKVTADFLNWLQNQLVPVGAVFHFAASTAPVGFLECNGDNTLSRILYPALYAVVGTTYGAGVDGNSFKLPDLRDDFIRGANGTDRPVGARESDDLKAHTHDVAEYAGGTTESKHINGTTISGIGGGVTGSAGGTETRPRNVALLACIKHD